MDTCRPYRVTGAHRLLRRCLAAVWLLLLAGGAARAQEPPRFLIETLSVEGIRRAAAVEIIVAESRLQEGRVYAEVELREAVYRIRRLPFVLNAEFSLRKGSERGAYELVITVDETRPVFYSADIRGTIVPSGQRLPGEDALGVDTYASLGYRHFVGTSGLAYVNVQAFEYGDETIELGYTQYGLLERGGFASVSVIQDMAEGVGATTATATLGIPLAGNHSLRSSFQWSEATFYRFHDESWQGTLDWLYDSTDDPLFPSRGVELAASVGYGKVSQRQEDLDFSTFEAWSRGLHLSGIRHWALTPRQTLSLGVGATESGLSASGYFDFIRAELLAQHSASLWGFEKTRRLGDLRLETEVTVAYIGVEPWFPEYREVGLSSALVFRNAWGITRLSLSYRDGELLSGGRR